MLGSSLNLGLLYDVVQSASAIREPGSHSGLVSSNFECSGLACQMSYGTLVPARERMSASCSAAVASDSDCDFGSSGLGPRMTALHSEPVASELYYLVVDVFFLHVFGQFLGCSCSASRLCLILTAARKFEPKVEND